jgi:hypothetical protein
MRSSLSDEQRAVYNQLKREIQEEILAGLKAFQRAGEMLYRIRDERLYREEFNTFEDFCRAELGHSKTYANNLIIGFSVTKELSDAWFTVLPNGERVARELAKYPRDMRKTIWARSIQIAEGRKLKNPTYKMVRDAAKETLPAHPVVKEVWFGQMKEDLKLARRLLSFSLETETLSKRQLRELAVLVNDVAERIQTLAAKIGRDAFEGVGRPRMGREDRRDYG